MVVKGESHGCPWPCAPPLNQPRHWQRHFSSRGEEARWWWDLEAKEEEGAGGELRGQGTQPGWLGGAITIQENQGFPRKGPWRGCGALLTPGLTPLVVDVESATLVYTSDDLVVGAVEAVHADHTGLLLGVGIVRVGGVEIILKHSQAIQMLDLRWAGRNDTRQGDPPSAPKETPQLPIQTSLLASPNFFHSGLAPYFTLFSSAGLCCS